jgi:hypothetical protein
VRRDVLVPLMPARAARGSLLGARAFAAEWTLEANARLHLVANLSLEELPRAATPRGELLAATAKLTDGAARLPPWYVEWRLEPR